MKTTDQFFKATHVTKHGFGGLLIAGIKVEINTVQGDNVFVNDENGNGWHGKSKDLEYSSVIIFASTKYVYFTSEAEIKRYCKAQMMKTLFSMIEVVKVGIQSVKQFREENMELLNHEWTERQINKLEKEINR